MKIAINFFFLAIFSGMPGNASGSEHLTSKKVSGIVVDQDSHPLAGALLEVSRAGTFNWTAPVRANAKGEFVMALSRGKHLVTATVPGYASTGSLVEVHPDRAPGVLRLVMSKGGVALKGKVFDPRNTLVSTGEVWVQNIGSFNPSQIFHTRVKDGTYSFSLAAGGYRIFWRYPGLRVSRDSVMLDNPTTKDLCTPAQAHPAGPRVLNWIRNQAVPLRNVDANGDFSDLKPFGDMIGSAKIVGLGEASPSHPSSSRAVRSP